MASYPSNFMEVALKVALWGILEYLSQSNDNTDFISNNNKFGFIDDLSILEKSISCA